VGVLRMDASGPVAGTALGGSLARGQRHDSKPTPEVLVHAVAFDKDLLEPAVVQRRLGLTGPGFHGLPETAWEPPTPQSPWRRGSPTRTGPGT